ncbi:Disintegrin and metalloproteinase domain-containing protein 17 [Orchesella cincta]|uniref:Disintegrin and metalloproteinase domain-containing protein 17 n=1 Tax=Orchesella cincta TaxID=48709 RepID=A0A1D2MNE0_ORCCI|nr:Disintegrin and metalloproteinase domain-containing protein 17 [Orchesella cincta]
MALIIKHLRKFCLLLILVAILVATSQGDEGKRHRVTDRIASNINVPRRVRRQVSAEDQHLVVAPTFDQQIAPNMILDDVADDIENEQIIHRRADLNPTSNLMVDPHLLKAPAAEGESESDRVFVHDVSDHFAGGSSNNDQDLQTSEFNEDKIRERKDGNAEEWESALNDHGPHDFHRPEDEPQKPIERREPRPDLDSDHPVFENNEAMPESKFTGDKLQPISSLQKAEKLVETSRDSNDETDDDDDSFTLFTIANTDIGTDYNKIPYREQYRWDDALSNCASFNLKIPDEKAEKSVIKLCIFRPYLEFPDETELFKLNPENGTETKAEEKLVYGYVMNHPGSTVRGRIQNNRYFFGEVSFPGLNINDTQVIYFVEDIHSVFKRMHINDKSLRHMLMVMTAKNNKTTIPSSKTSSKNETRKQLYNAAVTKGVSLNTLLDKETNPNNTPFLMLTTNHNSYIILKEPQMWGERDGKLGKIKWGIDPETTTIEIDIDGAVHMKSCTNPGLYFPSERQNYRTSDVQTLQEHEGPVAITAYSKQTQYDCLLPTPAFEVQRKGGYVCKVCVVTDRQFAEAYDLKLGKATPLTQNYMGKIIDQVSWMFRTVDWNSDKHPDNVGLSFDSQPIDWRYPNEIGDDTVSEQVLIQSLQEMNLPDNCCLAIGYTMKRIAKREDGKGQRDKVKNEAGRVCNREEGKPPNNMIVISASATGHQQSLAEGPIQERKLVYLTAHKVASAFGASLDGNGQDVCDQFVDEKKQTRHYLMWPDKLRNTTLREQTLSQCSISQIKTTLATCHSSCFDNDEHPFCGNGLTEDGEECDCGSEYQCTKQTCCYSRYGERPCMKTGIGCKAGASTLFSSGISSLTLLTVFVTYYRISL